MRSSALMLIAAMSAASLAGARPASAAAPSLLSPAVHRLPNGLRVVIKDIPGSGLVAAALLVGAAPRFEDWDQSGISVLAREVALQGTTSRTAEEIAGVLEGVGGSLQAVTSVDYTQWAALTRPRHAGLALDLIADLVTNAAFKPEAVEAQRRVILSRVRQQQDSPQSRALDLALARLYALHPYGTPILGTAASVARITREQLVSYYQTYYTAPNMVLAITGDLRAPVALATAARAFGGLRAETLPRRARLLRVIEPALTPRPDTPVEIRESQRTAAAWIAISYLGVRIGDRDWAPLQVLTTIVGGGGASRLFMEIRDRQGLVYSIGAGFSRRVAAAPVFLTAGTDPPNTARVIRGMLDEIERLKATPVSQEELMRGRNRVVGLLSIDQEDLRQQAFYAAWGELLGVGPAFPERLAREIGQVSAADVQRVARRYLTNATVAVVLPPGP
ncbi:MAG TPA: pitrilysin family protein [bacterium]